MTTKTALITGAARRIGENIARDLHGYGMNVVIHYSVSEKDAKNLTSELNEIRHNSALAIKADLKIIDSFSHLKNSISNFSDNLDVLVNNASVFYPTPIAESTPEQWMDIVGTNMKAPYFLIKTLLPFLKKSGGCVINITDIYGEQPLPEHSIYSISKAGLIALTRSLAQELAPDIRVNAISPGAILWPDNADSEYQTGVINKTLLSKAGSVNDITRAVRFLIESDFITAQIINVDGGRL